VVSAVGPQVAKTLEGRGGGRAGRFQGKASHVERASEALDLLKQAIAGGAGPESGAGQ
jgi:alanyl-tRNA synthetase